MFLNRCCNWFLVLSSGIALAQQTKPADSIKAQQLDDVVVTAQFSPQSVRKAANNVRVISKADLKKLAANNLSDVLNQCLNITIRPNSSGQSRASLFGLDGSYFKIMVDNIPIVSDNSMGTSIDLTQINLDDIEQVEIIEGSMGVTHGAGAVSGILNIITKKSTRHKWEINTVVQEETAGEEYSFFNKGKHIQSVKVSNTISENWFASVGFNRNDFAGYLDNRKGKDYINPNDNLRGFAWLPKLQHFGNGMLSYSKNDFKAFYKFDYMNENIDYYHPVILGIVNPPFDPIYFARDIRYKTERLYHHLNAIGKVLTLDYNVSLSHQTQTRDQEQFEYHFADRSERNLKDLRFQEAKVLYSTGTLSNFFKNSMADLQLGYEAVNNHAYAFLSNGGPDDYTWVEKRFENYDFFVASEIKLTERFLIRPGMRISLQSQFNTQDASSLGLRYLFDNNFEVRTSMGKSYRVPTFEELYSKIQFSGHNFLGNENLVPEQSTSYDFNIKKATNFKSGVKLSNQVSVAYLEVDDRIDMAFVGNDELTQPIYQYINISAYKMWNIASTNQFSYKNWNLTAGVVYVGISRLIDNNEVRSDDKFYYNFQANASLSYEWQKADLLFSAYYKFNGVQQQFTGLVENNAYVLTEIESYSFLDASIRKSFFKKQFELTVGARNLLDVTRVNQGATGGTHSTASDILLGYGRSYFVKLMYNLNF